MLELEENKKQLIELNKKLKELGESLWHNSIRRKTKKFRRKNYTRKFLVKYARI